MSLAATLVMAAGISYAQGAASRPGKFPGIGRAATPAEVAARDIDVRPDAGGTTKDDTKILDYIYRAMLWNAPRSLSYDHTYAFVAYILSLGEIVPDDFVLSNTNIKQVQAKCRTGIA